MQKKDAIYGTHLSTSKTASWSLNHNITSVHLQTPPKKKKELREREINLYLYAIEGHIDETVELVA